jgi:predicted dehydrogenase
MTRKLGVGVIGVGVMGRNHVAAYSKMENVKIVGIADLNTERAEEIAGQFGVKRWFTEIDDLLKEPELEAVSVVTPDFAHRDIIVKAAEAGKHVLSEKPLATTLEECDEIINFCQKNNVKLMVHFLNRFSQSMAALHKVVSSGEIGDPLQGFDRIDDTIYVPTKMLSWAGRSSPAFFLLVHAVDRQRWFLGSEAEEVYATSVNKVLKQMGIDTEDSIQAIVHFRNGTKVYFESSWILPNSYFTISENQVKIIGSKGCAYVMPHRPNVVYYMEGGSVSGAGAILRLLKGTPPPSGYHSFVDAVLNDKTPPVTGEDGRAATEVVLAMRKSAALGKPIKLPLSSD